MKARHILVVEDDEDDFFLTQRALRRVTSGQIFHVDNGRAAIDYLAGRGDFADREKHPWPDLMFLDLKMNPVTGTEVLHWVRDHLPANSVRIIVLTGSNEARDWDRVKLSGVASGYVVKPLSAEHLGAVFAPAIEAPASIGTKD